MSLAFGLSALLLAARLRRRGGARWPILLFGGIVLLHPDWPFFVFASHAHHAPDCGLSVMALSGFLAVVAVAAATALLVLGRRRGVRRPRGA